MKVKPGDALRDLQATVDELARSARSACRLLLRWTMAWAAASRPKRRGCVLLYGGQISRQKDTRSGGR